MHLVSKVVFEYDIRNGVFLHNIERFSDIKELQNAVKKHYTSSDCQPLVIRRSVQIIDTDKTAHSNNIKFEPQIETLEVSREVLCMYITTKIMYPRDVRKILKQRYGSVLNFDSKKLDKKQPICEFHVYDEHRCGLRHPTTNEPTEYVLRNVHFQQASQNDIIVDKKLNQIWPVKTKQMPKALIDLLAKTTEEIHQR